MSLLPDLNGEFCLRLTLTLLHFLWQGAAIALLAAGAGAALRRTGAAARYWVFVAALGAMALCPLVTYHTLTRLEEETGTAVPQTALSSDPNGGSGGDAGAGLVIDLGAGLKPAPAGVGAQDGGVSQPGDETRTSSPPLPPVGAGLESVPAGEQPQPDASLLKRVSRSLSHAFASDAYARVAPWVAGGYFAGVLAMLTRLLLALRGGRGLRRNAQPVTEPALRTVFTRAAAALHLRVLPAVAWCERVGVPTVVGLLKPTILLPLSLSSGFTPEQIEMLLLHELAHLRRHDHWVNLAQWVVETAMFFHPAVWWVSRRIRAEREIACDDRVLAAGVDATRYADSLLRVAEISRRATAPDDPTAALALGSHGSRFSGFGQRVLRLIEGRDTLESLRPARVWPVVLALILLLAGCYAIACRPEAPDTRQSNDPLGIQYRGLQVGLSDSLYNPNGEKIGERLNWQYGSGSLFSKEEKRRFIFDFPKTSEPIFFDRFKVYCGGTPAEKRAWRKKAKGTGLAINTGELRAEMDGQTRQLIVDVPGFSPRDQLYLPSVGDIALCYYYGPPGKSLYRFSGPFIQDREQRDQGGVLCPQEHPRFGNNSDKIGLTYFTLKLGTPIEKAKDGTHGVVIVDGSLGVAIAYDKTGKRYRGSILPRWGAKAEDWLTDLEFSVNVPIGEIETITIGEKPYEVWVKGIQVTPLGSEEETRNEMAEIARVFEIPDMKYDQLLTYDFKANPDKALRSLPLFRGYTFDSALRAVPPEKFQGLSPEFLKQLHHTALRLSQAPLPHWKAGIWLGFQGDWPEFYGLALDRLADPELQNFITFHREGGEGTSSFIIADFFSKHSQEFPDDLVPKIEKAVSVVEESFVFSNLMKCLTDKKTSTTTEALLRLAKDEHPWIWVSALKELSTRKALAPEESLTPPERIRLTVARALSGSLPEKTTLEPEVESALLTILSDGAKNLSPTHILDTLHRYDDPKTTLRAAVEFLQKQNPYGYRYNIWPIPTVTRWINQNYDVNIGELGTGSPNDLSYEKMSPTQLGKQITDTCTWYEQSEYFNGTPLKRPFFQSSPEVQAGETKDAPLDIRFIGFQTGLGDSLYNAKGEKIGERLSWPGVDFPKDKMNWRFLFELPKTDEFPLFERFPILCASGKSRESGGAVGGGSYYTGFEMEGQTRQLFYDLRIDREGKLPKAVDFCLRYFSGPPREPLYSFSGPFERDKTLTDRDATLSFKKNVGPSNNSIFSFESKPLEDEPYGRDHFILAYDASGKRYLGDWSSGERGSSGVRSEIRIEGVPLDKITRITIGEKPREFVVKNIRVAPPGAREETQAQLALIAHALEVPEIDYAQLMRGNNFTWDPDKAIRSLPYLRGNPLMKAWEAIADRSFRVRLQNLSPEALEQLHQTALKWAQAPAPHCDFGILMGLQVGWPEFDTMALDLLKQRERIPLLDLYSGREYYSTCDLSSPIAKHSADRPDELVPQMLEMIRITQDPATFCNLMRGLLYERSPITTNALLALTKDDRPWAWASAFHQLSERNALPPETERSATDKLRLATTFALRNSSGQKPEVPDPEVESQLIKMLTPEMLTVCGNLGGDVPEAIHRYCNREKGTRALVEYIQKLSLYDYPDKILRVVHWINRDYGVNIGGVGSDPNISGETPVPPEQLKKLLADVATWQKTETVPGDHAPEKPVVLEFQTDRSIGTTWIDTLNRTVELQGHLELPVWATPKLIIRSHPESFAVLEQLKPLKSVTLEIGEMDLQDEDLQSISQLPNLYGLTFKGTSVTKTGLKHLKNAAALKELNFEKARVPEDVWETLQFCSNLEFLRIPSCQLTGAGLGHLKTLAKLRGLNLSGNRLTDESLEGLKDLPSLTDLNLSDNPITDQGLVHLAGMKNLRALYLPNTRITDQGLVHLAGMKNLRALYLPNTQITDAGLDNLSTLTELWDLSIGNTRITDAGLARLPKMHQIYSLDLTGTWITDASVEILKRYPTLQMLTLTETSVTEQGIAELKKFLPHVYFPEFKIIKKENPAPTQPAQPQSQPQTGVKEENGASETTATTSAPAAPPAFTLYRLRSQRITAEEALQKPLAELELAEAPFLSEPGE